MSSDRCEGKQPQTKTKRVQTKTRTKNKTKTKRVRTKNAHGGQGHASRVVGQISPAPYCSQCQWPRPWQNGNILMAVAGGLRMRGAAEAWTVTAVSLTAAACPLPLHLRFDLPRKTLGGQSATPSMHPCCPSTLDTRDRLANLNSRHKQSTVYSQPRRREPSDATLAVSHAGHGCNRQQTAAVAGLRCAPGSGLPLILTTL
jgi:hypothetical protein